MSKPTSGPWHVYRHSVVAPDQSIVAEIVINGDLPETKSNACLIAAAPELLAALKLIVPLLDGSRLVTPAGKAVLAAIAKAEGKS